MNEELIDDLFAWVDKIPLSRPKKDLKRDFSDGVLIAEVVKYYYPSHVDLHNYPSALGVNNKIINWKTLNRKVFRKLKFEISEDVIRSIVTCQPNAIQQFLLLLRCKIEAGLASNDYEISDQQRVKISNFYTENNDGDKEKVQSEKNPSPNGNQSDAINNLQKMVLSMEMNLISKNETIDILKAKVKKLENMMELKEIRRSDIEKN